MGLYLEINQTARIILGSLAMMAVTLQPTRSFSNDFTVGVAVVPLLEAVETKSITAPIGNAVKDF
jgi:hypothetical protein